jgi:hypothetical protein
MQVRSVELTRDVTADRTEQVALMRFVRGLISGFCDGDNEPFGFIRLDIVLNS